MLGKKIVLITFRSISFINLKGCPFCFVPDERFLIEVKRKLFYAELTQNTETKRLTACFTSLLLLHSFSYLGPTSVEVN